MLRCISNSLWHHILLIVALVNKEDKTECIATQIRLARNMGRQWGKLQKAMRWVARSKKNPLSEEQLRAIFMAHDKNGDGHLDKQELKEAFRALGARVPSYRADRAIYYADIDLDGAINEDEIDHLVSYAIQYGYSFN